MYHPVHRTAYSELFDIIMKSNVERMSSSLENLDLAESDNETNAPPIIQAYVVYSTDDYLATRQSLKHGDFSDEKGITALPRRGKKAHTNGREMGEG